VGQLDVSHMSFLPVVCSSAWQPNAGPQAPPIAEARLRAELLAGRLQANVRCDVRPREFLCPPPRSAFQHASPAAHWT